MAVARPRTLGVDIERLITELFGGFVEDFLRRLAFGMLVGGS